MSSAEESPAQRAARLRRERRETRIKEGGAARLDKITSLSGRTPSSNREDVSPSPSLQTPASISSPSPEPRPTPRQAQTPPVQSPPPPPPPSVEEPTPDILREQQEAFRALLRQPAASPSQPDPEEDPTLKLLNALMGGMAGAGQEGGPAPSPGPGESGPGGLADIASALGLPPFVASLVGAATQTQTEEQKRAILVWKILHTVFAVVVGIYLVFLTGSSIAMYGSQPPPPATVQNPFLFFTTGELVLSGARVLLKSRNGGLAGPFMYIQLLRDIVRDGSIVLFLFGMGAWWTREWTTA